MGASDTASAIEYPDIFSAIMSDDIEAIEVMLAADPGLAERQAHRSPILLAAYRHRRDALDSLLRHARRLDFFEAAATGALERVRAIASEHPEQVRGYSEDGLTALHLAAFFGHEAVVAELLDRGARVDALSRNDSESMPLHAAVAGGHRSAATLLLERGAPVDAQEEGGVTALHAAARRGNADLVRLLLAHGANRGIETDGEMTAADLAYEFEHDDLAAFLRRREV